RGAGLAFLFVAVADHELFRITEAFDVAAKNADAERVERRDFGSGWKVFAAPGGCATFRFQERGGALLHFGSRFFGERDGDDAIGFDATANERGDAIGDNARLAGACAGEDQQWPAKRSHGVQLRGVEIGGHGASGAAANPGASSWAGACIEPRDGK